MNEWSTDDDGTGIWSLKSPAGAILVQIQHNGEEYVMLPKGQRLGKDWGEAARTAEEFSLPASAGKKKGRNR